MKNKKTLKPIKIGVTIFIHSLIGLFSLILGVVDIIDATVLHTNSVFYDVFFAMLYFLCVIFVVNGIGNYVCNLIHTAKAEALDDILTGIKEFAERSVQDENKDCLQTR